MQILTFQTSIKTLFKLKTTFSFQIFKVFVEQRAKREAREMMRITA